jgi:DNA repair protein REV1
MGSRLEKNSSQVRKRIESHSFNDEDGEEYEASEFGGFGDYFRRKKIKLQNLDAQIRESSADKPQIFKGVVVHIIGFTQPPLHILHRELVQHGAGFLQYLDSKTMATHIIASALPPKKAVEYSKYRIVKPQWVTDSIQTGRLLPWHDYKVIEEGPRQNTIKFDGGKMTNHLRPQSRIGYREQSQNSFYNSQFRGSDGLASQALSPFVEQADIQAEINQKAQDIVMVDVVADQDLELLANMGDLDEVGEADVQRSSVEESTLPDVCEEKSEDWESGVAPKREQETALKMPENMTSEEHNAWLLSDPKIRKASSANPDFIKQFYSESRLHHLSTWKAELKSRMQRLAAERGSATKPVKRKPGSRRYVMHVDFDSFFCAVSLKRHPEFVDKPAVVAHGTGTGSEIASCNYPARKFGVKNGMWMKRALELCPDLKVLPYDFPAYEEASRLFYESIMDVGGIVQSVSVDEALVDITGLILAATGSNGSGINEGSLWREQEKADEVAAGLRTQIKDKTKCSVSIGIGGNILLAKVALRKAKPAGQHQIKPDEVLDALADLEVKDLPGVAYSIGGKLEEIGVKVVKDIRQVSKERLSSLLGPKTGEKLWEYARGIDKTEVGDQPPRKSVSAEVSWGIRFINQPEAEEFVMNLCKELERRLLNEQVKGKHLTMKIMRRSLDAPLDPVKHLGHGKCDTFNKSVVFGVATNNAETIGREAVSILRSLKFSPGDLRGLGAQLTKLEPIKSYPTSVEASQKKLAFPSKGGPPSAKKSRAEPIEDGDSPVKQTATPSRRGDTDPIADDPLTPRKPKSQFAHPALALAKAGEGDKKSRTPINITGTQFLMPTQVDPTVLAELPPDIRRSLVAQRKMDPDARDTSPVVKSRIRSPVVANDRPYPTQVDPEVFNALPEEMKAEVLAAYGHKGGQSSHAQSPWDDNFHQPKKPTTPSKRRGMGNTIRERQRDAEAHRLQTNLIAKNQEGEETQDGESEELDPEVLAELPEEVRREVLDDHRRRRLAKKSGLDFNAPLRRYQLADEEEMLPGGQTKISFPPAPSKATFAGGAVKSTQAMKDMLRAWHSGTLEEGPHGADVEIFEKYLGKIVLEERNMEKASKLVRWLDWIVEADGQAGEGKDSWKTAVARIKTKVQGFTIQRGLGPLKF